LGNFFWRTLYKVEKSACMQSLRSVGRTDTMDSNNNNKWGVRAHLDPNCQKLRGSCSCTLSESRKLGVGSSEPHRIAAVQCPPTTWLTGQLVKLSNLSVLFLLCLTVVYLTPTHGWKKPRFFRKSF